MSHVEALLRSLMSGHQEMLEQVQAMEAELKVRREVLPRLLSEATGKPVSWVLGLEARLMAEASEEASACPEQDF